MRAIILHGTMGSPEGNWFPWLSQQLCTLGVETIVPRMPTPENQTLECWRAAFAAQCGAVDGETILIGHSCGAVMAMRLLEEDGPPIRGTVLVAPPYRELGIPEFDRLNSTFLAAPFQWERIIARAGELAYLMGDNDQFVPQEQLLAIAAALRVTPTIFPGGGHLNAATGYTSFPELLETVRPWLRDEVDELYLSQNFVSPESEDTEANWNYILELCRRKYAIGYGVLDSFLFGPDLERRMALVEHEAVNNPWLRGELKDTLHLNHENEWTTEQRERMMRCAGL